MAEISRRSFLTASAAGALNVGAVLPPGPKADWKPVRLETPVPLEALHTPALIVDMDQLDANLRTMADFLKARNVGLRPHTKTHKCPHLAHKQMDLGAVGVCAAKTSEAEAMANAGIDRVLITSPVATKEKIVRIVDLAKRCAGLQIVIDHPANAADFDAAAAAAGGITLGVLIDLDPGIGRTGIAMGEPALALARHIAGLKHLRLDGIQCYAGNVMHIGDFEQRRARSAAILGRARDTKALIEADGIELGVFSVGGTGTYDIDSAIEGVTDLQCGSYLVMDVQYGIVGAPNGRLADAFPPSMFVWSTAISQPVSGQITIDAGLKAIYRDSPYSELRDITGVTYSYGGDEHGILRLDNPSRPIALGGKLAITVAHCDPTINLYDAFHAYRDGTVEEVWPITARGMSQ